MYIDENADEEGQRMTSLGRSPPRDRASRVSHRTRGDLAIVWFDLPGEKVNKFSTAVMSRVRRRRRRTRTRSRHQDASSSPRGKPGIFIAGADVIGVHEGRRRPNRPRSTSVFGQQTIHRCRSCRRSPSPRSTARASAAAASWPSRCDYRVMSD